MSVDLMDHVFRSLEKHFTSAIPREPQQPMPGSPALVEGSSPTAGIGTADAGIPKHVQLVIDQQRQSIYEYQRLIDQLYDLARADRWDELHDLVRQAYLGIHGE